MLVIRMQRTGRKGHAMFRVVVQDSRQTPTSGKVVAQLGSYDPHSKAVTLNKEKAQFYLDHGAQPSERISRLLKAEGIKLPDWVKVSSSKERTVRNADKRRSTRPDEPAEETPAEEVAETPDNEPNDATEEVVEDKPEEIKEEKVEESTEKESDDSEQKEEKSEKEPEK